MEGVGLTRGAIPKGSYKDVVNNDVDIPDDRHGQHIVAHAKVPADVVHDFTRSRRKRRRRRKVHPAFKDFVTQGAPKLPACRCIGRRARVREAGLLK